MTRRISFNGGANLEPGDRGTMRFAYPFRLCAGDRFVGVLEERFEIQCRVTNANAVHLGT